MRQRWLRRSRPPLRAEGVDAIRAYFAEAWGQAATRFRIVAENTDER